MSMRWKQFWIRTAGWTLSAAGAVAIVAVVTTSFATVWIDMGLVTFGIVAVMIGQDLLGDARHLIDISIKNGSEARKNTTS